ncbi:MAG: hypothetical protein E3J35_04980 [Methanomassiliicoccales archaeon]|nr:MAG: hypothetical protein E3J35_04980 [Methanomassiliicoccales archaeon]
MSGEFNIYVIPSFISVITSLVILSVLLRNGVKRDYEKTFALLLIGLSLWSFSRFAQKLIIPPDALDVTGYNYSPDMAFFYYPIALFSGRMLFPAAGLILFSFLYFSLIFPKPCVTPRHLRVLKYALVLLLLILSPITLLTDLALPHLLVYWAGYGIYDTLFTSMLYVLGVTFLLIIMVSLFNSYRKSDGLEKKQIRIIMWGGGVTMLLFILLGLLPSFLHNLGIYALPKGIPLGSIVVLPFEFGVLYSILRYRLFDTQLVIRKGLINGISVGIASTVVGSAVLIPYFFYQVELQIIIISAVGVLIFLFFVQNSVRSISIRIVESLVPSLKWKECETKEIYLIHYPSGITLDSLAPKSEFSLDPDIVGGMVTAVTNFVHDSFHAQDRDTMRSLVVGDVKLMIEHSKNTFIVIVFTGFESSELRTDCQEVLSEIEVEYGKTLETWDGDTESVAGIRRIITRLLPEEQ